MDSIEAEIAARRTLRVLGGALVLWHRTPAAAAILRDGFIDVSQRSDDLNGRGVYLSSCQLDRNEGAKGRDLLRVLLRATEAEIDRYEVIDDEGTYREWCIPAAEINGRATIELWDEFADEGEA